MHARHRNPANGYRSNPIGISGGGGGVVAGGPGYRSYNRSGFGRGQPKIFQPGPPNPPLSRRVDVFMEAGKLATEYLVSKGLLPPNSLNGKWPNANPKHIGDGVSGSGGGRRSFSDCYSTATGSRDSMRAKRTMGSFKNPGFELDREINRSASWSERIKGSSDKEADDDSFSGKDGVLEEKKSVSAYLESNSSVEIKQNPLPDDNPGLNAPNSVASNEDGVESADRNDCSKNMNTSTDDNREESKKPMATDDNAANKNGNDLLTLIRFNKVPTRTRSSLTLKVSKPDSILVSGDEKRNDSQISGEPVSSNQESNHGLIPCEGKVAESDHNYKLGQGLCTRSQSFPQRSSFSEQESSEGQPLYNRCTSAVFGRGEKRPLCPIDSPDGAKKLRDDCLNLSNSRGDQEGRSVISEPSNAYAEEKQLFPGSFKICDLNLMEVSDANENHDTNSVVSFPSIRKPMQEPVSVDFDLSMNSSCGITDRHTRLGANGKEIEVIDLDCDSGQDDKVFSNSERKDETIFTDLESFPDSMQRVSEMPQDGYGLMISELLDADIPSSSVPTGVNSMHNEIGLRNEEGILGDDESIYMSLGEIPISFVPVWDQQSSQGYDKRY